MFLRLIENPSPQSYGFWISSVDLPCGLVEAVKQVVFEEVGLTTAGSIHRVEVIWDSFPKRDYRLWVAWVDCSGGVIEAIVKRSFEEVGDAVRVSKTQIKAAVKKINVWLRLLKMSIHTAQCMFHSVFGMKLKFE